MNKLATCVAKFGIMSKRFPKSLLGYCRFTKNEITKLKDKILEPQSQRPIVPKSRNNFQVIFLDKIIKEAVESV